jgi:hypothetical protein
MRAGDASARVPEVPFWDACERGRMTSHDGPHRRQRSRSVHVGEVESRAQPAPENLQEVFREWGGINAVLGRAPSRWLVAFGNGEPAAACGVGIAAVRATPPATVEAPAAFQERAPTLSTHVACEDVRRVGTGYPADIRAAQTHLRHIRLSWSRAPAFGARLTAPRRTRQQEPLSKASWRPTFETGEY